MIAALNLRDSLTVLAILVIGVLTAALVGPYFIDWNSHRALIERKLSAAAGTSVTVSGPIDLKILPRPILRLGDVTVGDAAPGRPRIMAAALDAELSLTALMRGQVQVVDTTLQRPRLDLAMAADGSVGLALPGDETADRFAFDHIGIRDGTLTLGLADGRRIVLSGLDADGEASSLRGPVKVTGEAGAQKIAFRLATGAVDHGRLRVKLHVEGAGLRPDVDVDGSIADRPGSAGPSFDGTAVATGRLPLDGNPAMVPWRMTAHLTGDRDKAAASEVELRAGADMRALIADGDASASYGAKQDLPKVDLHLQGAALDVDSLAVAPEAGAVAAPAGFDVVGRLLHLVGDGAGAVSLPLHLKVSTRFDTATLGGRTLLGTSVALGLGPEPTAAVVASVDGPDGTHLGLDGRIEPGPPSTNGAFGAGPVRTSAVFHGRAEARSKDITRTAAWLSPAAPDVAAWLDAGVPGRVVAAAGDVDLSGAGLAARNVNLSLDGSTFNGALALTRAVGNDNARFFADLSSDALDLDHLPDLSKAAGASRDLDLDLTLSARAVTVANVTADAASLVPISAGHVALHLSKSGDDLKLDRFSLNIDGAEVDATASRSGQAAHAAVHVVAPRLGPLADAVSGLLPGSANMLRGRAAALSPVDARLAIEAMAPSADGTLGPTHFALAGTAGGTTFDATLSPDHPDDGAAADVRPVSLTMHVDASDAADLLRQLGLPAAARLGSAHVEGQAQGTMSGGFTADVKGALGDVALSYAGRVRRDGGGGQASLHAPNAQLLLSALGLAAPSETALRADAAGDVTWTGSRVDARHLAARIGTTNATGDLAFDLAPHRPGAEEGAALRGSLSLDRLPVDALLGLAWGSTAPPPPASPWSNDPFGPVPPPLPRGEVALRIATLPLRGALEAQAVTMTLRTGGGAVTLADLSSQIAGGTAGGTLTLRRDGANAAMTGHLAWNGVSWAGGGLSSRLGGTEDLAGTGTSPAALVGSLAGTGQLALTGAVLARIDPLATSRTAAQIDARDAAAYRDGGSPEAPPEADAIRQQLAAAFNRAPLPMGDAKIATTLAGGILRTAPVRSSGAGWTAESAFALDIATATLTTRTTLGGGTAAGTVVVTDTGPAGGTAIRAIDAAGLVGAIQASAIARAQEHIDIMEQDIRERAAFNRQLKAIKADQQAARERAEAEKREAAIRAAADATAKAQAAAEAIKAAAEAAKAAAEAQAKAKVAAQAEVEARSAAAERRKAEDARLQAEVEAAARTGPPSKAEADKQRFFDKALKALDPPLDLGARNAASRPLRHPAHRLGQKGTPDPFDPPPAPSILRELGVTPEPLDPSAAGRY